MAPEGGSNHWIIAVPAAISVIAGRSEARRGAAAARLDQIAYSLTPNAE
jgi:hypothetical protein